MRLSTRRVEKGPVARREGLDGRFATRRLSSVPAAAQRVRRTEMSAITDLIPKFCVDHRPMDEGARSLGATGVAVPGGQTLGAPDKLTFGYDPQFMEMKAQRKA